MSTMDTVEYYHPDSVGRADACEFAMGQLKAPLRAAYQDGHLAGYWLVLVNDPTQAAEAYVHDDCLTSVGHRYPFLLLRVNYRPSGHERESTEAAVNESGFVRVPGQ